MSTKKRRSPLSVAGAGAAIALLAALLNPLTQDEPDTQIAAFAVTLAQYLSFATSAYLIFWFVLRHRMKGRKLSRREWPKSSQLFREAIFSSATQVVFVSIDVWVAYIVPQSAANSYSEISQHGWLYYAFIVALIFILHDTYFYWAHRMMHHPKLYHRIHSLHHESTDPTPFSAFHFHPFEAVLEGSAAIAMLAIFCFLPWHASIPLIWGYGQLTLNVIGHLGYEIFPPWWNKARGLRYKTTGMHHYLHHQLVSGNYGLYFRWWDKLCGTEFPDYEKRYDRLFEKAGQADRSTTVS